MKKLINSFLIALTLAFSPSLNAQKPASVAPLHTRAEIAQAEGPEEEAPDSDTLPSAQEEDSPAAPSQEPEPSTTAPLPPSDESTTSEMIPSDENEGTPVGQAASEGSKAAKKKQWQNIAIATVAIAVAVTALILIANNDGHHKHD